MITFLLVAIILLLIGVVFSVGMIMELLSDSKEIGEKVEKLEKNSVTKSSMYEDYASFGKVDRMDSEVTSIRGSVRLLSSMIVDQDKVKSAWMKTEVEKEAKSKIKAIEELYSNREEDNR